MPIYLTRHHVWAVALISTNLALALTACEPAGTSVTPADAGAIDAVRSASAAWDKAHNAGQLDALMQLYSESAVSMPYSRPALEGRPAIEADFRSFFEGFNAKHRTTIVSLEVVGDWAIERGKYELSAAPKAGGSAIDESGKHIVIRRKVDGAWKIQWEIWNTDAAPAP